MAPKGGGEFLFAANPDLADILGDMDFDFENVYFLDPGFLDSWFPGWMGGGGDFWTALDVRRSKELGKYRENPISASSVWGM